MAAFGGGPERAGQQRDGVGERDLDLRRAGGLGPAEHAGAHAGARLELLGVGGDVDAVVGQDLVDVVPVRLRDHLAQLGADVAGVVDALLPVDASSPA